MSPKAVIKPSHRWTVEQAETRFDELLDVVQTEGPQFISVDGRDALAVVDARTYRELTKTRSADELLAALRTCPDPEVDLSREYPQPMPVRDVSL